MRKSGQVMTTIMIKIHIDKRMVEWVAAKTGWSNAKAFAWVAEQFRSIANDRPAWYRPVYTVNKEIEMHHVDQLDYFLNEGGSAYTE